MGQLPENNAEQGDQSAAIPAASLGRMLREARERLGLSVADVATQIKFAPRQIESLEADDFMHLPEAAFLRGFVRSYAKILQLDAQTLFEAFPQSKTAAAEQIPASVNEPFPIAHSSQRQNQMLLGAALLIAVVVAGFAVWHFTSPLQQPDVAKIETPVSLPAELSTGPAPQVLKQDTMAPSITAETKPRSSAQVAKPAAVQSVPKAQPADAMKHSDSTMNLAKPATVQSVPKSQSADSATPPDGSITKIKMRLVFEVESWAEIKDRDGTVLSARVHEPGTEMRLGGLPPVALVIGRAGSVHLFKNDEPVDLKPYTNSFSEVARLTLE
jgi:cytoskeleton protein RodZ